MKIKDNDGKTYFMHLVQYGDEDTIQYALNSMKVNINAVDNNGASALFYTQNPKILSMLVTAGIDMILKYDSTASFMHLVQYGDEKTIEYVLNSKSININQRQFYGRSALFFTQNPKILSMLVKARINMKIKDNGKKTSFMHLVQYGDEKTVQFVLNNRKIIINEVDEHGRSALFYTENPRILSVLVNAGINMNIKDRDGKTGFMYIVEYGDEDTVSKALNEKMVKINEVDYIGKSALFYTQNPNVIYAC